MRTVEGRKHLMTGRILVTGRIVVNGRILVTNPSEWQYTGVVQCSEVVIAVF